MPPVLGTKLARVAKFFGIKDLDLQYWLGQVIVPTFEVAPYVKVSQVGSKTTDITGTLNTYKASDTVPSGRRWHLRRLHKGATTGVSRLAVQVKAVTMWLTELATLGDNQEVDITLDAGDSYGFGQSGNVADSGAEIMAFYEEEDA